MFLFEWVIPAALVGLAGLTLQKKGQEIKRKYQVLQQKELEKIESKKRPAKVEKQHVPTYETTKEEVIHVGELELEETL